MAEPIKILITDDHEIFRQGLVSVLEDVEDIDVCGEASDGEEAIRLSEELLPDVVLMDINMPGIGGIAG